MSRIGKTHPGHWGQSAAPEPEETPEPESKIARGIGITLGLVALCMLAYTWQDIFANLGK